jgi:hypothetical protein
MTILSARIEASDVLRRPHRVVLRDKSALPAPG